MQKTLHYVAPLNISPLGGLYLEIALKYKVKQSKNGTFPSSNKASLIDFEKRPLKNISCRAFFGNFMVYAKPASSHASTITPAQLLQP